MSLYLRKFRYNLYCLCYQISGSQNQWEQATFSEGDGEMQAKFRRLMGMSKYHVLLYGSRVVILLYIIIICNIYIIYM